MKSSRQDIHGILLLDKPLGISSNQALQRVKRLFNAKKAGHTGNLDPLATGMLPLCFGEATKFSQYLLDSDKTYVVKAQLGVETTTGDAEGEIKRTAEVNVTQAELESVITRFIGDIIQIPPMFSALKFQGKPLYELARQGIEVERKPRSVTIFEIELLDFANHQFTLRVTCSKGTYIRTLVEDIGAALNCGAHVLELRRTEVKPYTNAIMYTLEALQQIATEMGVQHLSKCLLPMDTAIQHLPILHLSSSAAFYLRMGQSVRAVCNEAVSSLVRLLTEDNHFLGLGEVVQEGIIKPHRLVAQIT